MRGTQGQSLFEQIFKIVSVDGDDLLGQLVM